MESRWNADAVGLHDIRHALLSSINKQDDVGVPEEEYDDQVLLRLQLDQQLTAAEFDEVLVSRCERPDLQKGMNGFAGMNKISGLFADRFHGVWCSLEIGEVERERTCQANRIPRGEISATPTTYSLARLAERTHTGKYEMAAWVRRNQRAAMNSPGKLSSYGGKAMSLGWETKTCRQSCRRWKR